MTFTKALIGLATVFALSGAQAAAPTTMPGGDLGTNPVNAFFFGDSAGATDTYSFKLSGAPSFKLSTSFAALFSSAYVSSVTVSDGSFARTVSNPVVDTATFTGLSAGNYTISFATTTLGSGNLIGSLTATAVPEAQTAALALVGVGVMGVTGLMRRRRA